MDISNVMQREQLCSEHAAYCFIEAKRREKQKKMNMHEHKSMEGKNAQEQSTQAIRHVLRQISTHPDVYNLMGPGTESFDLLTESYSMLTGEPLVDLRKSFANQPQRMR